MKYKNFTANSDYKNLNNNYRISEQKAVENLLSSYSSIASLHTAAQENAANIILNLRSKKMGVLRIENLLKTYRLSTKEGLALMCMAESLIRIPDNQTKNNLIRDKLSSGDWKEIKNNNWLDNILNFGLVHTTSFLNIGLGNSFFSAVPNLLRRFGEPLIRHIVMKMIKIMGTQFVVSENISNAVANKGNNLYSFDMLGESAKTAEDAEKYFNAYLNAIIALKNQNGELLEKSGISIKLSALYPRYEVLKRNQAKNALVDKLTKLCQAAKESEIILTVDAEETERLQLSLEIIESVYRQESLKGWGGFGMAIQAYQKRATAVIDFMVNLVNNHNEKFHIRLVKGAYWDSEIKWCQERGLEDYPVFTQKAHTDLSYLVCAEKILKASPLIYGQFATHNAYTACFIKSLANKLNVESYELQRLYGMGESLYEELSDMRLRIYGPVGIYKDLLAYLVRRLIENGSNSSFVHQIHDEEIPIAKLTYSAEELCYQTKNLPNSQIKKPEFIYENSRRNSKGTDLSNYEILNDYENFLSGYNYTKEIPPISDGTSLLNNLKHAADSQNNWQRKSVKERAKIIESFGELLQENEKELVAILCTEARKTISDSIAEVREAIDFCYYYANCAINLFDRPLYLPSPAGEINKLTYHPRGVFVCISPWNFPLAIFLGQAVAALVSGNAVMAKPAHQTLNIAYFALMLAYKAGIPKDIFQIINCRGSDVSKYLLSNQSVSGVVFTGSTETAQNINKVLANRPGAIVPLIAETGGMNAMIVDSSALHEQVVGDIINSAFQSAGQRCSALRILFVQEDIESQLLHMLINAMKELKIGVTTELDTDVGQVIDSNAKKSLEEHIQYLNSLNDKAELLYACNLNLEGDFVAPQVWKINNIEILNQEVFGPILHVISFKQNEIEKVFDQVNNTGYGLTMGIHSRLESTMILAEKLAKVGNIYINRNMIGAVVGVQPFGGEGLSGTGPKAGGPNYLMRFVTERTLTNNITACGGNIDLLNI